MTKRAAILLLLLALSSAGKAATDPALNGPFTAARETVSIPGTAGATLSTDVFSPRDGDGNIARGATPCPVVLLGHGFGAGRTSGTMRLTSRSPGQQPIPMAMDYGTSLNTRSGWIQTRPQQSSRRGSRFSTSAA
ncbi:hypothetical protein BH20VER1_BH20VER1_12710 [soil metagenome]